LVNRLIGVERSLVDERPGTTHDPVDSRVVWKEEPFVLVDTAGIRRRSRVDAGVEAASVLRALRAMGRAEVVVLLCDATQGISEQDTRLLGLCCERQRAALVALNKVDLLSNRARRLLAEQSQEQLGFARWVPIVEVSAKTGHGLSQLVAAVVAAAHEYRRRVPTSQLNQFFERALERHPPPTRGGRAPRIYYITQAETRPPVFVAMTSAPGSISQSYQRFVTNQIRKAFGFQAVPLVVHYRKRSRRSD
jgi:GTP-binding protein